MKPSIFLVLATLTLGLTGCSQQQETGDTSEAVASPEQTLSDEAKASFDTMDTDQLVEALRSSRGQGVEGEYADAVLLAKLQAMPAEEAASFERRVPRGTDSFSYAFRTAGEILAVQQQ